MVLATPADDLDALPSGALALEDASSLGLSALTQGDLHRQSAEAHSVQHTAPVLGLLQST
jgi:hypothetical protein